MLNACIGVLTSDFEIKRYFYNLVFSNLSFGAMWFLTALFICTLISVVLIDYIRNSFLLVMSSFVIAAIGIVANTLNILDFFRWQEAVFCVTVFVVGYLLKMNVHNAVLDKIDGIVVIGLLIIGIGISAINGMAVLSRMDFGKSIFLFWIGAMNSVISWRKIASWLVNLPFVSNMLAFYGVNSMIVLVMYQVLLAFSSRVIGRFILTTFIKDIIVFLFVALIEIIVCFIINKTKLRVLF